MAKLEAILFDVDGTLAETERDGHRVAFNMAFKDKGLDWEWSVELYHKLLAITGGKERIRHYIENYLDNWRFDGDLDALIKELHLNKNGFYGDLIKRGEIQLRPGVERILKEGRDKGIRMAIVTTTSPENVDYLINGTLGEEAMGWFELIAAGDIVPAKKPAPDIYFWAMEKMNLKPEQCIAVEDSRNGILSARAADLTTVITQGIYTVDDDFTGAALIVDQLGEPGSASKVIEGPALEHGMVTVDTFIDLVANA